MIGRLRTTLVAAGWAEEHLDTHHAASFAEAPGAIGGFCEPHLFSEQVILHFLSFGHDASLVSAIFAFRLARASSISQYACPAAVSRNSPSIKPRVCRVWRIRANS